MRWTMANKTPACSSCIPFVVRALRGSTKYLFVLVATIQRRDDKKISQSKETNKEGDLSDSYDGAFLFLLLHKRVVGTPDDFSASELQDAVYHKRYS